MSELLHFKKTKQRGKVRYELHNEADESVGELSIKGVLKPRGYATFDGQSWIFARHGLRSRISVSLPEQEDEVATYTPALLKSRGQLTVGEQEYTFKVNALGTHQYWENAAGEQLVAYQCDGLLKSLDAVTLAETSEPDQNVHLLTMLGAYINLQDYVGVVVG